MVKIPDQWAIPAPSFAAPTGIPKYDASAFAAPGRAQAQMGEAIGKLGHALGGVISAAGKQDDKAEEYRTATSFVQFKQEQDDAYEKAHRGIAPDGAGFQDERAADHLKAGKDWFKTVPDKLKPEYDYALVQHGAEINRHARTAQFQQQDKYHDTDLTQKGEGLLGRIQEQPEKLEEHIQQFVFMTGSSPLPTAKKEKKIREFGALAESRHAMGRLTDIDRRADANYQGEDKLGFEEAAEARAQIIADVKLRTRPLWEPAADALRGQQAGGAQDNANPAGGPEAALRPIEYKPMPAGLAPGIAKKRDNGTADIKGFVIHETASATKQGVAPTLNGFVSWSNESNTGANYYVQPDGTIHQMAPDDQYLNHVRGPEKRQRGDRPDLHSGNTLSVEIITRKGERPTPEAIAAAENLVRVKSKEYGFNPTKDVYGHEELDRGHREASEGMDVVKRLRSGGTMVANASKIEVGVNKFAPPSTPGILTAAAEQTTRAINKDGYGDKLTGTITVNGTTYKWNSGGREGSRGSIPTGTYEIQRYTSASQRASEGKSLLWDSFELNAAQEVEGRAAKEHKRDGLLIHDGRQGVTAGCIGIDGDFERFKKDLAAEQQKNGGKLKIQVGTKTQLAEVQKAAQQAAPQVASGAQPRVMLGFKGVDGAFDQKAFEAHARALGYEPKVITAWNTKEAVAEANKAIKGNAGPYAVYGFSLGAQSARDFAASAGTKPEQVVTVGAYKDARLDFGDTKVQHYFDKSGVGNPAKGEMLDAPHTGGGNVQQVAAERAAKSQSLQSRTLAFGHPDARVASRTDVANDAAPPELVRGQADPASPEFGGVERGDLPEPLAVANGPHNIQTILDGYPNGKPLSALPDAEREAILGVMSPADRAAFEKRIKTDDQDEEGVAAEDVVTIGSVKEVLSGALRTAEAQRADNDNPNPEARLYPSPVGPPAPMQPKFNYKYLTEKEASALVYKLTVAQRQSYLAEVGGEIDHITRNGVEAQDSRGRTFLDRAKTVLEPNQFKKARIAIETAKMSYAAIEPLRTMGPDELRGYAATLAPTADDGGDLVKQKIKGELQKAVQSKIAKLMHTFETDAAAAVNASPEVRAVVAQAQESRKLYTMGQDASGALRPGMTDTGKAQMTEPEFRTALTEARIAAQERAFNERYNPDKDRDTSSRIKVITADEAKNLIFGGVEWSKLLPEEKREALAFAAQRAEGLYGRRYAKRAYNDALQFVVRGAQDKQDGIQIATQMISGKVSLADMHRYRMLQSTSAAQTFLNNSQSVPDDVFSQPAQMNGLSMRIPGPNPGLRPGPAINQQPANPANATATNLESVTMPVATLKMVQSLIQDPEKQSATFDQRMYPGAARETLEYWMKKAAKEYVEPGQGRTKEQRESDIKAIAKSLVDQQIAQDQRRKQPGAFLPQWLLQESIGKALGN